jgi:hypothetical protein
MQKHYSKLKDWNQAKVWQIQTPKYLELVYFNLKEVLNSEMMHYKSKENSHTNKN